MRAAVWSMVLIGALIAGAANAPARAADDSNESESKDTGSTSESEHPEYKKLESKKRAEKEAGQPQTPVPEKQPARKTPVKKGAKKIEKKKPAKETEEKAPPKKRTGKNKPPSKAEKKPATAPPVPEEPFKVVVNSGVQVPKLSRDVLADIFLKKTTFWPNGEAIRPVDLVPDAKPRRAFSSRVLNRPVSAVRTYWQQRIFTGRGVPPPELKTDQEVIDYVRSTPGAIGYVAGSTKTRAVRVVNVR